MAKFRVTSAIKYDGKIYPEGAVVALARDIAAGLHVEPLAGGETEAAEGETSGAEAEKRTANPRKGK